MITVRHDERVAIRGRSHRATRERRPLRRSKHSLPRPTRISRRRQRRSRCPRAPRPRRRTAGDDSRRDAPARCRAFGRRSGVAQSAADFEPTVGEFEKMPETRDLMPDADRRRPTASSPPSSTAPSSDIAQDARACSRRSRTRRASTAPPSRRSPASMADARRRRLARASRANSERLSRARRAVAPRIAARSSPPHGDRGRLRTTRPRRASNERTLLDFDMPVADAEARYRRPSDARRSRPSCRRGDRGGSRADRRARPASAVRVRRRPTERARVIACRAPRCVEERRRRRDVGRRRRARGRSSRSPSPSRRRSAPVRHRDDGGAVPEAGLPHRGARRLRAAQHREPGDQRLADKVASLRAEAAPAPAAGSAGPRVLRALRVASSMGARRRRRTAGRTTISAPTRPTMSPSRQHLPCSSSEPASYASDEPARVPERRCSRAPAGGSIDALFGNRPTGSTEDSAASALAQAFGGSEPTRRRSPATDAAGVR